MPSADCNRLGGRRRVAIFLFGPLPRGWDPQHDIKQHNRRDRNQFNADPRINDRKKQKLDGRKKLHAGWALVVLLGAVGSPRIFSSNRAGAHPVRPIRCCSSSKRTRNSGHAR